MNTKLYYSNPYLKETLCTVESIERKEKCIEVITDKTIFYPECGGQPGDIGTLGSFKVAGTVKADNGDSVLILPSESAIEKGQELKLVLDWDHRYKYMVIHAAQHMLSGLLFNEFNIGTVSVHQGEEYLTIETDREHIDRETIDSLVEKANRTISEGHTIKYHEVSHEKALSMGLRRSVKVDGDVRLVEIEGVDIIACGGVHVSNTSEIAFVLCCGHEQVRGHERLYFKCGAEALNTVYESLKIVDEIRNKFTCSAAEVVPKVNSLNSELYAVKKALEEAGKKIGYSEIVSNTVDGISVFTTENDLSFIQNALNDFDDLGLCVFMKNSCRYQWMIVLKGKYESVDFAEIRKLFPLINAKGGGRSPLFQGVADCCDNTLIEEFKNKFRALLS